MDNRYPYPPSEAMHAPGISNNYPQGSYNASGPPPHNMNANAANSSTPGGSHTSTWNTSQMFFPPPTLPRPDNFSSQPMPHLHHFNQSEPPPPIPVFAPPPGLPTPPGPGLPPPARHPLPTGFHPPPGSGLAPPTGLHPPPGSGLAPPAGLHSLPGSGLASPTGLHPAPGLGLAPPAGLHAPHGSGPPQLARHPPSPGLHPPPSSGLAPPTGLHPPPSLGLAPPAGLHPPPGSCLDPPPGFLPPPGPGLSQTNRHPTPSGIHPPPGSGLAPPTSFHPSPGFSSFHSPGPTPPFTRPNHRSEKQVHPEVSTFFREREKFVEPAMKPLQPEDEATVQRRADDEWIKKFVANKEKLVRNDPKPQYKEICIREMKNELYSTAQLVSQLSTLCENLKLNIDNQKEWSNSYVKALKMKRDIQGRLKILVDKERLGKMTIKLSNIAKRRDRRQKLRQRLQMEQQEREVQIADKDVAVERWRMKKIHAEEEKKKEQELKQAADAVLCEIRKKLSDVKRMQNIMKSLEKLRKLRKEAASRKGIHTDPQSDETFNNLLEELREVAKKWTEVYSAEEKMLMVMVEGEQEEERKRDLEMRRQKERDKQLRKKRKVDAMLFGDDTPADPLMQPFRQYYTQAEHSLPALVQIRQEWDVFLVPMDHPKGTTIPQGWVIPDAPSDQAWASALQSSECDDV